MAVPPGNLPGESLRCACLRSCTESEKGLFGTPGQELAHREFRGTLPTRDE